MTMEFEPLEVEGSYLVHLRPLKDNRGHFIRTYDREAFEKKGLATDWVQESQSLSRQKNTVRGLHFQTPPHSETKLIQVIQGRMLDVFADLRKDSSTYGKWDAVELSAEKATLLYLPKGIAHGFCTLTEDVIVAYKMDAAYVGEAAAGILWNDPTLAIPWPTDDPITSDKDRTYPTWEEFDSPF